MIDPASLQILIRRLDGIAAEMGAVLRRAAFSPNIKERADCSAALFTTSGELLARAEHIPVHLGSMPASVAAVIERFGDGLGPHEQAIVNDPFAGGTHLNDVTVVAPCWVDDRLVGWAANRAHHADVGGSAPGSIPADATEVQQEGIRIPPVRLTADVVEVFVAASRTPVERRGDLDAQVGANRIGVARLAQLADAPFDEVLDHGERRMRRALMRVPAGEWSASDVLDSAGPRPSQQSPSTIAVTMRFDGDEVIVDLTESDAQRAGNVNAPLAVTTSAVMFALVSVLDPTLPVNGGTFRPVRIDAISGSVVAATEPVAVGAGNVEVSQRVADVCLRALAGALPGSVPAASQGTMNNVLIGGASWVYYETVAGGQGGRPPHDGAGPRAGMNGVHTNMTNTDQVDRWWEPPRAGMSAVHTNMTNSRNTPIEALERSYPLRVMRYRIRKESGGAGLAPGGDGIERDLQVLEDVTVSLIAERHGSRPWGLADGEPGAPGEHWLLPGGDESRAERLPDKCTIELHAGDVLRVLTPGGGGWGEPARREPE